MHRAHQRIRRPSESGWFAAGHPPLPGVTRGMSERLGVRCLLNLAHMTLGEYPEPVDPHYRLSLTPFPKSPSPPASAIWRRVTTWPAATMIVTATSIYSSNSAGRSPGDQFHNAMFENPGHGRAWITLKLRAGTPSEAEMGSETGRSP